jgi:hypothetical protein
MQDKEKYSALLSIRGDSKSNGDFFKCIKVELSPIAKKIEQKEGEIIIEFSSDTLEGVASGIASVQKYSQIFERAKQISAECRGQK